MTGLSTQVFQMRLEIQEGQTPGCVFSDESTPSDETYSFFYAIPWRPDLKFDNIELIFAGEKGGSFTEFLLHFDGQIFTQSEMGLRFAFHDPLSPQDFRGLPFLRSFAYMGGRKDVLAWYGITEFFAFLQLIPLDLIRMDELFVNDGIIFTGVTTQFGRHFETQNTSTLNHQIGQSEPLNHLFMRELSDLYDAEHQWIAALPKITQAATSIKLKNACAEHLRACRAHVERLDQVFASLGVAARRKRCRAMTGLVNEGEELIRAERVPQVLDTGIVNAVQRVEHYEICEYGTVRTMAEALGFSEAASHLERTLREKEASSGKLRIVADALLKNIVNTTL